MEKYYLAVDIGASSGRHILGHMENGKIELEEIYRFENGMDHKDGKLLWDVNRLFGEIVAGMKKCKELGKIPVSMAIDTWAVDYVLPGIDDGSRNIETSIEMLRLSRNAGVDRMIATPHFYADEDRIEHFLEVARERGVPFQATRLETKEEAQNAPTPVTTYALFYNGEYLTNEQMNDKRFIKLLDGMEK